MTLGGSRYLLVEFGFDEEPDFAERMLGELLEAGVRIYEYTPGFIHSKVVCVDMESAVVGTVNMDFRSLYLH